MNRWLPILVAIAITVAIEFVPVHEHSYITKDVPKIDLNDPQDQEISYNPETNITTVKVYETVADWMGREITERLKL